MNCLREAESSTKKVYEEEAQAFADQRGKSLFEKKWLDLFLSKLPTKAEILDVGCGPAKPIAQYLIDKGSVVSGIDYSKSMIEIAQRNFPENEWLVQDMVNLNLKKKFDGLIAWNSFFHLTRDDQKITLRNFAQHLKENGILLFTAGPENGEVLGKVNGRDVYHSSLSVDEYQSLLKTNAMELVDYKLNDPECGQHSVFLARVL